MPLFTCPGLPEIEVESDQRPQVVKARALCKTKQFVWLNNDDGEGDPMFQGRSNSRHGDNGADDDYVLAGGIDCFIPE